MTKIYDPLLDKEQRLYEGGDAGPGQTLKGGLTTKQLIAISHLDNQHAEHGPRTSNDIIVNQLGGIEGIVNSLESNEETGINPSTVAKRQACHGTNVFPPPVIKGLWELVMENFNDPINVILCGAAVVSIIIGLIQEGFPMGLTEGLSIMVALVIIFVVNSGNNYMSERQLAEMLKQCDAKDIAVWRGSANPDMISKSFFSFYYLNIS